MYKLINNVQADIFDLCRL